MRVLCCLYSVCEGPPFKRGVYIQSTDEGSVARAAGIRAGDRILHCNGMDMTCMDFDEVCFVMFFFFFRSNETSQSRIKNRTCNRRAKRKKHTRTRSNAFTSNGLATIAALSYRFGGRWRRLRFGIDDVAKKTSSFLRCSLSFYFLFSFHRLFFFLSTLSFSYLSVDSSTESPTVNNRAGERKNKVGRKVESKKKKDVTTRHKHSFFCTTRESFF